MKKITMTTPLTQTETKKFWVEDKDVVVTRGDINLEKAAAGFAAYAGGMPAASTDEIERAAFEYARQRQIKEKRQAEYDARPQELRDVVDAKKAMQKAKYDVTRITKEIEALQAELAEAHQEYERKTTAYTRADMIACETIEA
ncbi:MAG: BREX-1 system adenine-specific DNA-methyltransferase PglX [Actinobacteria bacterium]|nr:BREX-1 system adenine-specific DNA-methyltransferase PglX [Actinomycetota bacterium]MCA1806404.1 BREX-1 system adenine-specific DNA-methyltransferase PglX [Actinomycetota bacterium]